ncbi:GHKL domain-containing protein [Mycobacterium sp. KBS0706]|uniref:sensor histidine kinase n=1 Tax=Mycobacterium sp. KBS0706 TaxID=2578109 RepID=UPI00110F7056|nr:ATP-binding protein [Mycobacterium sp. KBS0706]TSD84351.1 GHKL domain-containing protein [Mycobacterium sp. KBS0706]
MPADTVPGSGPGLGRIGPRRRHWHRLLALLLGAAVFVVDTFTDVTGAIAVLYVLVMLLASDAFSRRGLILLTLACAGLAVLSFFISHGDEADVSAVIRCGIALAAIGITTVLLLRDQASKQSLVAANAALARSETRYRSIFEQVRVSLWEQDFSEVRAMLTRLGQQGVRDVAAYVREHPAFARDCARRIRTMHVNDATAELLRLSSPAEALGPIERFLPAGDPALPTVLAAVAEGSSRFEGRAKLLAADGQVLTVLLRISFPDEADEFGRVVVGMVDVTEREQLQQTQLAAQAELARASRAATVGALSASIAHEINQPLGAVVMNAQTCLRWLGKDPPDVEAAVRAAERTVRDGRRAAEIVQRTRGQLVRDQRNDEAIDLRALIEETIPLLETELSAHAATVVTRFAPSVPPVRADRVALQQVLINLMTNGLHAMAETQAAERELTVSVDRPDGLEIRVSVRDRGKGIPDELQARLFEPFFTTKRGGMGMGLAICRSTIETYGGQLTARTHEQGGAVFEFALPADPDTAQAS